MVQSMARTKLFEDGICGSIEELNGCLKLLQNRNKNAASVKRSDSRRVFGRVSEPIDDTQILRTLQSKIKCLLQSLPTRL